MSTIIALTPEYRKRTISAINETQVLIDREMAYSPDLRKTDKIEFWKKHIEKLAKSLEDGHVTISFSSNS